MRHLATIIEYIILNEKHCLQ